MNAPRNRSRAALARDAALLRVSRTRRWLIAGTAALTAGFAALVSALAPGHSLASKAQPGASARTGATGSSARTVARASSGIPAMPAPANPAELGLQAPGQAPSPAPDQSQSAPTQSAPSQSAPSQSAPSQPPAQSQSIPSQPPSSGGDGPVVSGGS